MPKEKKLEQILKELPEIKPENSSKKERTESKESEPAKFLEKKEQTDQSEGQSMPEKIESYSAPVISGSEPKTIQEQAIEKILAEGLEDIYLQMSPDNQQKFKQKGEEATKKINQLLNKTKIKLKMIINLIKRWLAIIPGVNRFFLEQEAKIKADRIVSLKHK
jgi:flagellar biosynthesis GTPase FlhF